MKTCKRCFKEIHPERAALGYPSCVKCASTVSEFTKYKGVMVYDRKDAGEIQIMSTETFAEHKEVTKRIGQSSILRRIAPAAGRLI